MNKVVSNRQMLVTTLSPVHMGTDEDYQPTNYVIDGDTLFEFDTRAVGSLSDAERKRLLSIVSGTSKPEMLTQLQQFFYTNREALIAGSVKEAKVGRGVQALYEARVGRAANVESDGIRVQNKLEIGRMAYNPIDRLPILPGSGIKGAMRTALLDEVNQGDRAQHREKHRDMQARLFRYRNERNGQDLHRDPMRLISVGDLQLCREDAHPAEICFAVNRKKRPVRDKNGDLVQSMAEKGNLYQLLETIPPFRLRAFVGRMAISELANINAPSKLPDEGLRFDFERVAAACNQFYWPVWDAEWKLIRERGYGDAAWTQRVEALLSSSVRERVQANRAFLLRVGRHSGSDSVTLHGARQGNIKVMRGRGERPRYADSATTLWLASEEIALRSNMQPYGWLLVELVENLEDAPQWPEAETLTAEITRRSEEWRSRFSVQKQASADRLRAQKIALERQRSEAEKRQREELAREEQKQRELQEKTAGLPEDATYLVATDASGVWSDNSRMLNGLNAFLDEHKSPSAAALVEITKLVEKTWPDIMDDNVRYQKTGKKQKPRFKPGPVKLAERIIELSRPKS